MPKNFQFISDKKATPQGINKSSTLKLAGYYLPLYRL